ncbi:MAG: hypothetical protein ACI8RD_011200, partial [Bacillariaceae sp.]
CLTWKSQYQVMNARSKYAILLNPYFNESTGK